MSGRLAGKRAMVTGASRGIGFEIAKMLLEEGAKVVICARNREQLERALKELRKANGAHVAGQTADVSDAGEVGRLFEFADRELGGLDILINNAGVGIFRPAAELTVEEWNRVIGTNLSGTFYCSREALARLRRSGGGWIVNIGSLAGKNAIPGGAAYNASKFGVIGFSEAMMLDHRREKVRVSYIMPGSVDTEFAGGESGDRSSWKIAPEEIAEIVLDILRKPERTLVSRVEVRPSRPEKY